MKRTLKWGFFRKAAEVLMDSRFFCIHTSAIGSTNGPADILGWYYSFMHLASLNMKNFTSDTPLKRLLKTLILAPRKNLRDSLIKHKF